jgi:hypothetical protein
MVDIFVDSHGVRDGAHNAGDKFGDETLYDMCSVARLEEEDMI